MTHKIYLPQSGYFALIILLIAGQSCQQDRININIPTAEEEAAYIWRNIQDIAFFEANNYQLSLPKGPLIDELIQLSKVASLTDSDYERLEAFVRDSVYRAADYQRGSEKIREELPLLNQMIDQLHPSGFNWDFKTFAVYQVNLTLYGPGGSYDPDEGSILIFTTSAGQFKNYDNPSNTLIHEVIHIGMEEAIVGQYNLSHPLKERIVDTFVSLYFGEYLSEYRIQNMGETRTDPYLQTKADLVDLDKIVEEILEE